MDCFNALPHHIVIRLLTYNPPAVVTKCDVHYICLFNAKMRIIVILKKLIVYPSTRTRRAHWDIF